MRISIGKNLLFLLLCLSCSALAAGTIHRVMAGASGTGKSWKDASGDLGAVLAAAKAGDEVWVGAGTYHPSPDSNRLARFTVPDGVAVYGGFAGREQRRQERNWQTNPTLLSGNIGHPDSVNDNSYTIVYFERVGEGTVLDGFTLTAANANGFEYGVDPSVAGGAVFNNARGGESSPLIRNCTFLENRARKGAAIYNWAKDGTSSARIENCAFVDNRADFNGGALLNNGDGGSCNVTITDCSFVNNYASYGGAIYNRGKRGECMPRLNTVTFKGNRTGMSGSVLYNKRSPGDRIYAFMEDCRIDENFATVGNVVENNGLAAAKAAGVR